LKKNNIILSERIIIIGYYLMAVFYLYSPGVSSAVRRYVMCNIMLYVNVIGIEELSS